MFFVFCFLMYFSSFSFFIGCCSAWPATKTTKNKLFFCFCVAGRRQKKQIRTSTHQTNAIPKSAPRRPKRGPRGSQRLPRCLRRAPRAPKSSQNRPKNPQESPKDPQELPTCQKKPQRRSKESREGKQRHQQNKHSQRHKARTSNTNKPTRRNTTKHQKLPQAALRRFSVLACHFRCRKAQLRCKRSVHGLSVELSKGRECRKAPPRG